MRVKHCDNVENLAVLVEPAAYLTRPIREADIGLRCRGSELKLEPPAESVEYRHRFKRAREFVRARDTPPVQPAA